MTRQRRQVQQHREARRPLNQRSNRRAIQSKDEITFPVARYCAIFNAGRSLADHDLRRDERLSAASHTLSWHAQSTARAQARRQFTLQRSTALHIQRLVDRLVADAH